MKKESKNALTWLGIIMIFAVFIYIYSNPEQVKENREQNQRIEKSFREAQEIKNEQFCTRYMEYTEKDQAPYAYRYCWNYKDLTQPHTK